MLLRAEIVLAEGNFIKARSIAREASTLLDRTQELHRKFMGRLKKYLTRIRDMQDRGYDVSEASSVLDRARSRAVKSDYENALVTIRKVEPALDRATYLPFPLLNKTVNIISTIIYKEGKINYSVRIENPTNESLGEIIIHPFLPDGDFEPVQERYFGVIGPREYKESTFTLTPKTGSWDLGVGREVLMGEGVVLRTKLSSTSGLARYYITIENNSDQILRDLRVAPMLPHGLGSEPASGVIDFVEPFAQRTVEFELFPVVLENAVIERKETIVKIGEEEDAEEFIVEEVEDWGDGDEDVDDELGKVLEAGASGDVMEGPRDFTPVEQEYDLISMVPLRYPTEVEGKLIKMKRRDR